ncbi:MAG: hypothetical protein ACNS60_20925 [Candidatus Cyclobacteriaceae bacterium M2_1C_046]
MKGNKLTTKFLGLILVLLASVGAQAQCSDWNWPEDKATAEEKNVLYSDAVRNEQYAAAVKPHRWLLQHAPDLNTSLYINGEKIFSNLADQTEDEAKKKEYIDSLMMMYDMRIQYCNEAGDVLNRKAYSAYKYNIRDKQKWPELLELYDKTFEMNKAEVDYYIILPYMSVIQYNAKYLKNLEQEDIMKRYDEIMSIIDIKMAKGERVDKLKEYKERIDGILVDIVNVDCDFVRENMAPKFKENPDDINIAKKIFSFMLAGKCTDDPLWLETAKKIQEQEPDYGLAKNIGTKCLANGDLECAEQYLNQAIELTEDPANKADIYMKLADMKKDQGSKAGARELYYKALAADPTKKEAYTNIGLLYFNSFNECKKEVDPVKDRAVFMAAYDMFQKAGNTKLMQSAKEQFPSKSDIFTFNHERGATINTGCWINEDTQIRARD